MNQVEVETNLFESLKELQCPPIKNVLNIESNKTIRDILLDSVYLEEKLNLFIWLMLKFESKLSIDFTNIEFDSAEVKCRKILEGLYALGIIDLNDFGTDRLLCSTSKNYKELILILSHLNELVQNKIHLQNSNAEDLFSLDLMSTTAIHARTNESDLLSEIITKRLQITDDFNFFKEYQSILQHGVSNYIPNDMVRSIKLINFNSNYFENVQLDNNLPKEELADFFSQIIIDTENQIKELSTHEVSLINLDDEQKHDLNKILNDFKNDLNITKSYLKEINLFVNNLENKSNEVNSIVRGVESNFGKSFYDLKKCYNQFKKFEAYLLDWSLFFKTHSERLDEFKKINLIDNESDQTSTIFNQQIKECNDLLGAKTINSTKPHTINANETVVDQLLLL